MKELIEVFIQTVKPETVKPGDWFMEKEINSIIQNLEIALDHFSNEALVYNAEKDANIETF